MGEVGAVGPQALVGTLAILMLFLDVVSGRRLRPTLLVVSLAGLTAAGIWSAALLGSNRVLFAGSYRMDSLTMFVSLLLIITNMLVILAAYKQRGVAGFERDFYALLIFSVFGGMVMAGANNLIIIYLGIELVTLPCYVLVAFKKDDDKAAEAALKYFLLAILTSVVMTYGMSLIYGLSGQLGLSEIAAALGRVGPGGKNLLIVAVVLASAGFCFKLAAAPFHFWAPDAYEGAPTPVTAFISAVPKFAALAGMIRVFQVALGGAQAEWTMLFAIIAVASMVIGNLLAYQQTNVKRLLAYSSIAHAGYLFVALAAGTKLAEASVLFYIAVYAAANLGAFFVIIAASGEDLDDLQGLATRAPFLAGAMLAFLLSLTGIPPLAGFMGKLFLFGSAIDGGLAWLAVIGVINSVISLGYYAMIIKQMYMVEGKKKVSIDVGATAAVATCLGFVATLGLFPNAVLGLLSSAVR